MRPPICEVCRRKAVATVAFADYEPLPDGMVGHPRGLGWFCRWHVAGARALRRHSMGRVVGVLRAASVIVVVGSTVAAVAAAALWIGS